jgi:hypothetical protein
MILKNSALDISGNTNNMIDIPYRSLVKPTMEENPASKELPRHKILA